MAEKYGYDAWDQNPKSLTDSEIADTINYAETVCSIWGSGTSKMDSWEKEHVKMIAKHQLTWREYRPLHLKRVARKNGINISDEAIDRMFEKC